MKFNFIGYVLTAFATTVILLFGMSIGIALSGMIQSNSFTPFMNSVGVPDFISGADSLFTIIFIFAFVLFNGIVRQFTASHKWWRHWLMFLPAIAVAETVYFYRDLMGMELVFTRLSYSVAFIGLYLYQRHFTADILNRVFATFKYALIVALAYALVMLTVSGFPGAGLDWMKFTFIHGIHAFSVLLAVYVAYPSFLTRVDP